jgi:glycosyltransferase involved in cell wall biosynthesis
MADKMDLLGMYIPTWNREKKLAQLLTQLIPQFKKYDLPVYISDDNSSDGTEAMVRGFQKRYKKLYYKKNDTGLPKGYAANLISVLRMGTTEFVWVFGDDDLILKDAVDKILPELKRNDFVQVNTEVWNKDFTKKLEDRKIFLDHDVEYAKGSHDEVMANARNGYAGFMGEIITRRSYLIRELGRLNRRGIEKRDFLHSTLFFRAIKGRRGKLIAQPLIRNRMDGEIKGREFKIWVVTFPETLWELSPPYDWKTVTRTGSLRLYSMIGITAINKLQHPEKKDEYLHYLHSNRSINAFNRLVITLILVSPNELIRALITPIISSKGLTMRDSQAAKPA